MINPAQESTEQMKKFLITCPQLSTHFMQIIQIKVFSTQFKQKCSLGYWNITPHAEVSSYPPSLSHRRKSF